jgi:uncharacterized protein (DUF2141 family)
MRFTFVLFTLLLSPFLFAQGKINAIVNGFENNKGVCRACLFDSEAAFAGKGKPIVCKEVSIKSQQASIVFDQLPQGSYAIALFHDENNNARMDKNFLGIPKEGYGASKNKLPFAAAPKFEENKFVVTNGLVTNLTIKLRYIL